MGIIVCAAARDETDTLCQWFRAELQRRRIGWPVIPAVGLQEFWEQYVPRQTTGAVLDVGDTAGFLAARRVREMDQSCAIVLIADTQRFAIQSLRLHAADYLLRPVTRERVERCVSRIVEA